MVGFLERAREHLVEHRPELHRELKTSDQVEQFLADQVDELTDLSLDLKKQILKKNPPPDQWKDWPGNHRAQVHAQDAAREIAFQQIVLDMSHPSEPSPEPTSESETTTT